MAASEAAVTAAMETLGCERLEMVTRNGPAEVVCRKHNVYTPDFKVIRAGQWTDRGCPVAVAAADAAVDADRASIQAEVLREAIREVQWVYDLQCPPRSDWFGNGKFGRGAFCAHRWWSNVLGGALNRLRDRADRIEGKP